MTPNASSTGAPLICIIVPVYNVERYLHQCLDSLISQSLKNIEIICIDDGSTDASPAILAEYAARDSRLRILTQSNAGQGAARNRGLDIAQAPYIMFCDSDDWYEQDMCETMLGAIEQSPDADMALCGFRCEWDRAGVGQESENTEMPYSGFQHLSLSVLKTCVVGPPFKIYRREFIEAHHIRFPEGLRYEDFYFWYVCAAHARGIYFEPKPLYHYRMREGSTMHETRSCIPFRAIDHVHIATKLWDYYKAHHLLHLWNGFVAELWGFLIKTALCYETSPEAREHITKCVQEFVSREKNPSTGVLPPLLADALFASLGACDFRTKHALGILEIRYTEREKKISFCGIPIYKRKFRKKSISWKVMGISFYKIELSNDKAKSILNEHNATLRRRRLPLVCSLYDLALGYSDNNELIYHSDSEA